MRASILAIALLCGACNSTDLARAATVSSPSSSGWSTPTPSTTPKQVEVGPDDCYGDADYDKPYPADPDDPPGAGDADECLWLCADDPQLEALGIQTSSAELLEVWDFDAPAPPTQYIDDPNVPGFPQLMPCGSWVP